MILTALRLESHYLEKGQLERCKAKLIMQPPCGLKHEAHRFGRIEKCSHLPLCTRKMINFGKWQVAEGKS